MKSYIFVAQLDKFDHQEYMEELNFKKAVKKTKLNTKGYSDFGKAFKQFDEKYASDLRSRSTIIIIGDARNNRQESQKHLIKKWKKKVKKIIWLNPESKIKWNTGDSIMSEYEPYCDVLAECKNLEQLTEVVDHHLL